uniref:Orf147a n=1 Tax=Eruca vesicaria subsp. sativa TaxID=29727 RepID=A0A088BGI5_ERUVS|nr:orf147a [Eruca vesicaria subsp. sativa]
MARHKATSGTLASRESYAFLYKQIKAREDLSSCGFKKQGSVQWICLENKVVFELGSSRKKVCLRRRLNQFTSWINFIVLFFWNFRWERPGEALTLWKESISGKGKAIGQINEERGTGSTSGMRASKSRFVVQVTVFIRFDKIDLMHI